MLQENMIAWRDKQQQEWLQQGKANMLTSQLQHRFGDLPTWASEKIAKADPPSLEEWGFRFLDAQSLEDVFGHSSAI